MPGEFCGQRSLAGCGPWGCKESDTTERLSHHILLCHLCLESINPLGSYVNVCAYYETVYFRLGLEPSQNHGTWFQDLMKLRFLMSHRRKNSVRDKVIGKKWIYSDSERSTLHRVWVLAEGKWGCERWHG